jgi:hypothetical protein
VLDPMEFVRLYNPKLRGHQKNSIIPILNPRNNSEKNCYFVRIAKIWKNLPIETTLAKDINKFKKLLQKIPSKQIIPEPLFRP